MGGTQTDREKTDTRHLRGYRKFQNAALKALAVVVKLLEGGPDEEEPKPRTAVKVSDMKSLVSAYKEAVVGERMLIPTEKEDTDHNNSIEEEEICLRWVTDETAGPLGAANDDE